MQRVGLDLGPVLQQPVQDMDSFPDAARDEAGEQRYIAVGDMVVGNVTVGAIADVLRGEKIVLTQLNVRVGARMAWRGLRPIARMLTNPRRTE
jgi:hypothetical protein